MGAYYTKEDVSQYIVLNTVVPAILYSDIRLVPKATLHLQASMNNTHR